MPHCCASNLWLPSLDTPLTAPFVGKLLRINSGSTLVTFPPHTTNSAVCRMQLPEGMPGVQEAILQLLSAHDLYGASRLAAASGHPRLATLLSTAGLSPSARCALRAQLDGSPDAALGLPSREASWKAAQYFDARPPLFPPMLQRTYELLAGELRPSLTFLAQQSRNGAHAQPGISTKFGCLSGPLLQIVFLAACLDRVGSLSGPRSVVYLQNLAWAGCLYRCCL